MVKKNFNFREELTNRFLKAIEEKPKAWYKGWEFKETGRPINLATNIPYNGVNVLWLKMVETDLGFGDNRWATFKQVQDNGWKIIKGSKGTKVEYWLPKDLQENKYITWDEYNKISDKSSYFADEEGRERERYAILSKTYTVFNASQIEGSPELNINPIYHNISPVDVVDKIANGMNVEIEEFFNSQSAYYNLTEDKIHMPKLEQFKGNYEASSTALHELGHATGHKSRLDRKMGNKFGSKDYAFEELIAEITSCFMSEYVENPITEDNIKNHEAYIQSWTKEIKNNKNYLFKAIKEAHKASDYMIEKGGLERVKEIMEVKDIFVGEENFNYNQGECKLDEGYKFSLDNNKAIKNKNFEYEI